MRKDGGGRFLHDKARALAQRDNARGVYRAAFKAVGRKVGHFGAFRGAARTALDKRFKRDCAVAYQQPRSHRGVKPLVRGGAQQIYAHILDVDVEHSRGLRRVDDEDNTALAAERAYFLYRHNRADDV